jgi:hypothetical protein
MGWDDLDYRHAQPRDERRDVFPAIEHAVAALPEAVNPQKAGLILAHRVSIELMGGLVGGQEKCAARAHVSSLLGGEGGIRTHGTLRYA